MSLDVLTTKDKNFINQYLLLKDDIYKNELEWSRDNNNDPFNNTWHIVVVKDGNVIAGTRIILSSEFKTMSGEGGGFYYRNLFKEKNINIDNFAEVDDIIINEKYRGRSGTIKLIAQELYQFLKNIKVEYFTCVQSASRCRLYSAILNKYNIKQIGEKVKWSSLKEYNFSEDFAVIFKLT